jgi:hypothetical protein
VEHVDSLDLSEEAKRRLRLVLETLTGERGVEEACAELTISPARFHVIRRQALEGAGLRLEPRAAGRPPRPEEDAEKAALLARVRELRQELDVARIRTEIALVMPHVVRPPSEGKKGGPRRKSDGRRTTWSG